MALRQCRVNENIPRIQASLHSIRRGDGRVWRYRVYRTVPEERWGYWYWELIKPAVWVPPDKRGRFVTGEQAQMAAANWIRGYGFEHSESPSPIP